MNGATVNGGNGNGNGNENGKGSSKLPATIYSSAIENGGNLVGMGHRPQCKNA